MSDENPDHDLDVASLYMILDDKRRREVLHHLPGDENEQIRTLAQTIAACEENEHPAEVSDDAIQRAYIALYQSHIPVLEEEGLLEYDQATGTITPLPLFKDVKKYLALAGKNPVNGKFQPNCEPDIEMSDRFRRVKEIREESESDDDSKSSS